MVIKTYKRVFFRHWLDTFRYWNNWCFFLTDTCDTLNDRCLIGTYWTLWVKCLLVGHLQCIRRSTFQMLCTCRTLRLKKCYFVWHLKRFGVLLGWTCTSLRQLLYIFIGATSSETQSKSEISGNWPTSWNFLVLRE